MGPEVLGVAALVALRLVPAAMLVPVLGGPLAPWSARVALVAMAALALAAVQPPAVAGAVGAMSIAGWIAIAVKELAVGAVLAIVVAVPFLAADAAGRWIGGAIGGDDARVAGVGGPTSATGALVSLLAVLVFFGIDGHLIVIGALAGSYEVVPLTGGFDRVAAAREVLAAAAGFLGAAVALAAPALVAGALVELAVGVVARSGAPLAGAGALRGAAVVAFVGASLLVLAGALAHGTGAAARALGGVLAALGA